MWPALLNSKRRGETVAFEDGQNGSAHVMGFRLGDSTHYSAASEGCDRGGDDDGVVVV